MKNRAFYIPLLIVVLLMVVYVLRNLSPHSGQVAYETHCAKCHGKQGEGFRQLYPPLAGVDYLKTHREQLPCIIRYGLHENLEINGVQYNQPMLGLEHLKDMEITNIINYINSNWGNDVAFMPVEETRELLRNCKTD